MNLTTGSAQRVVARRTDGICLKGTTRDFSPHKSTFHLFTGGDESETPLEIETASLKAVFFVRTFEGDPEHDAAYRFEGPSAQGRRIVVTFSDGEVVAGFTNGYAPGKPGFFLVPADPEGNNLRIYVVNRAVRKVEWAAPGTTVVSGAEAR